MKNLLIIVVVAFLATACGTSKQVNSKTTQRGEIEPVEIKIEKCEEEAMAKSKFLRAYGVGISADRMFARDLAALEARNQIINIISVAGANMIEKYTPQYGSNVTGEMIREVKERSKGRLTNIAEETLKGSRIICSTLYKVGAEYEYHVCVELTDVDLPQAAYNKLSSDEKLMLDYEAENFKEDMNKELEKLRKRKQQGL